MEFDYERETKQHYKDKDVASVYHSAFANAQGWKAWRHRIVADGERDVVRRFLSRVPSATVLDLPCGTGKLAPVLSQFGAAVTACDISQDMLEFAKQEYSLNNAGQTFAICDAEKISETLSAHFDVAICLRLLHRVPDDVKKNILEELCFVADYSIVSMGIESAYHKLRRAVRNMIWGGGRSSLCYEDLDKVLSLLSGRFEIIDKAWIFPLVSQEMVFLLKPKQNL